MFDAQTVYDLNRELKLDLAKRNLDQMRESCERSYGVKFAETKIVRESNGHLKIESDDSPLSFERMRKPTFNWRSFREAAYETASRRFMEAQAEGVFNALLRAGINTITNGWYNLVDTNHERICAMTTSTHAVEPYAPVHRGSVPRRVPRGTPFPETKVAGPLDIQMLNEKFGAISSIEKELIDDDQSGIITQRVQDIGPNMAILEDAWTFQRFIGTAGSYGGDIIPASQTYPNGIWSTTLTGGGSNRLGSYSAFTSDNVQALDILLMGQKDLLGNYLLVNPNTLLAGINLKFAARTLLNSEWYPATTAMKAGGTGTITNIGTTYAKNVLDGAYNLIVSRFLPAKAYALGEAGKGIVFQMRDGLSVTQENPQSGPAFSQDEFRFRSRARWAVDWIDPRFWALGSDGSV